MEIFHFNSTRASHDSDIPTKLIKTNCDVFTDTLYYEFNRSLEFFMKL